MAESAKTPIELANAGDRGKEAHRAKKWIELKRGSFEGNEEIELWKQKLGSKEFLYAELEAEVALKVVGGGIQYDPSEKGDVASHFREIAKKSPTLIDAIKDKGKDIIKNLMPIFYDAFVLAQTDLKVHEKGQPADGAEGGGEEGGDEAPVEIEFKPFEIPSKGAGGGAECKMSVALKVKNGPELKCELRLLDTNPKEGLSGPGLSSGLEQEFKLVEDIPIGHGLIWTTPALKFEIGGDLKPNWKKILTQILENLLTDVGVAGLIELSAAGALIGVMLWAEYNMLQELMALESLPDAVPSIHEKLVTVVLDAFSNNAKPSDPYMAKFYEKVSACSDKLKKKVREKNPGLADEQYYEAVREEIKKDRDGVIEKANLALKGTKDQQPGYFDDMARQLAFVGFVKNARDAHSFPWTRATATRDGILFKAWTILFDEPPRGKNPYDKAQPGIGGRFRHDPHVYEQVIKEVHLGTEVSGDLDQYLESEDDGFIGVGASLQSVQVPKGTVSERVDPLAKKYLKIVFDAFAKLEPPGDDDGKLVYDSVGVKIREQKKGDSGVDDATYYANMATEVDTERTEKRGPMTNALWPRMQDLARIALWFAYARKTSRTSDHLGREGVWKGLFGKKPEDSPNKRLFDQVDDIINYKNG